MSDKNHKISVILEELSTCYANIILLLEQSLSLGTSTSSEHVIELNSKAQDWMIEIGPKMRQLREEMERQGGREHVARSGAEEDVQKFVEELQEVIPIIIRQLEQRQSETQESRDAIKKRLLSLQQNHKAIGAYKSRGAVNPRMLDSDI